MVLRDSAELSITRRPPGMLPVWGEAVIALACVITFLAVSVGGRLVWGQLPAWLELEWFASGLTFFVTFWMLASLLPPWRMSRMLRLAVLLPVAHVLVIACAWPMWSALSELMIDSAAATPIGTSFPLALATLGTLIAFAVIAAVAAKRRSGEWIHGFTMLSLAQLLLLGLWIPIACAAWPGGQGDFWSATLPIVDDLASHLAFVIVPPTLTSIAFAVLALRRPQWLLSSRRITIYAVVLLFAIALLVRVDAGARMMLRYANLMPVLLVAAIVAVVALLVLGGVSWWRSWRADRAFARTDHTTGTICDTDAEPVIGLQITSWLRGPRIVQRPFAVATRSGTLPVVGVHLVSSPPIATTQLQVGECIGVLAPGDDVQLAGHGVASGDPFRTSTALLADRLTIAPASLDSGAFASATLVMWRPCVAYLLIVTAIALPALAALLAV
jgi:hypothetical protein